MHEACPCASAKMDCSQGCFPLWWHNGTWQMAMNFCKVISIWHGRQLSLFFVLPLCWMCRYSVQRGVKWAFRASLSFAKWVHPSRQKFNHFMAHETWTLNGPVHAPTRCWPNSICVLFRAIEILSTGSIGYLTAYTSHIQTDSDERLYLRRHALHAQKGIIPRGRHEHEARTRCRLGAKRKKILKNKQK